MTENEQEHIERCNALILDVIRFGAEQYPDLNAVDAAGVLVLAGVRIGQRAGIDLHMAQILRQLADNLDQVTVQ